MDGRVHGGHANRWVCGTQGATPVTNSRREGDSRVRFLTRASRPRRRCSAAAGTALAPIRTMRVVKILAACGALLVLAGSPSPSAAADCASAPGDVDGDGLCDAHDPCEYGFALREGSLSLRRLGPPAGDDAVRVKGIMPLPERMVPDPSASGIRIVVLDGSWGENDVVLDVAAAPGPGWRVIVPGRSWSYRASDPASTGITRAVVKEIAPNAAFALPRQYAVVIDARRGTYGVTSDRESHVLSVAFAADGTTDVCAERA